MFAIVSLVERLECSRFTAQSSPALPIDCLNTAAWWAAPLGGFQRLEAVAGGANRAVDVRVGVSR